MKNATLALTVIAAACLMVCPGTSAGQTNMGGKQYSLTGPVTYGTGDSASTLEKLIMVPTGKTTVRPPGGGDFPADSFFDVFVTVDFSGGGTYQIDSFFDVFTELSIGGGGGGGQYAVDSFFDVFVVVDVEPTQTTGTFATEMVAMSLSGNVPGIGNVTLRESPTIQSTGRTTITDPGGGMYDIDSFFDVFTELSVGGGAFTAGNVSGHLEVVVPDYDIRKDRKLYGNLDQDDIPAPSGQFMCGPTAAVNSFVYLQNAYPGMFDSKLVPVGASGGVDLDGDGNVDSYDDMIAVAQTVGDQNVAMPKYMNTRQALGPPGGSGTWDDMFIYGKMQYIDDQLPGTEYAAQLASAWAWLGRIPGEFPPIAKPAWVQDKTIPTWQFLYKELVECEDVEILIVDEPWGHYLTLTGFVWTDADGDGVIDAAEGAMILYIDPATGLPGASPIMQQGVGTLIFVSYPDYPNAQLIMAVSESVPEPATMALLGLGGLVVLLRRKRA